MAASVNGWKATSDWSKEKFQDSTFVEEAFLHNLCDSYGGDEHIQVSTQFDMWHYYLQCEVLLKRYSEDFKWIIQHHLEFGFRQKLCRQIPSMFNSKYEHSLGAHSISFHQYKFPQRAVIRRKLHLSTCVHSRLVFMWYHMIIQNALSILRNGLRIVKRN